MFTPTGAAKIQHTLPPWYRTLAQYEKPDLGKALWQLVNTFVPYIALWALMIGLLQHGVSYAYVLPLIVLTSGFLMRIFIFFHDCGHGSFFASRQANRVVGYISGVLTFTPYEDWRHEHAGHHAGAEDLDRRGKGDVWTMTVAEFLAAPRWQQMAYRLFRNPWFLFLLWPLLMFVITQRFPHKGAGKRERRSVLITNLAHLGLLAVAGLTIGIRTYLIIQIPLITLTSAFGVWLFYVQHQYESVYWARHDEWDPIRAALEGSSYYRLPKMLQWFSGNIGLHHIHHLKPRIPNYNLQRCYDEISELQAVPILTPRASVKSLVLNLWDEADQQLVSFRSLKTCQQKRV